MEQKFSNNSIDLQVLREFCEREGEAVSYRKGDQMEREGEPSRWFGYVTDGCFKYVTPGISDDREHITWFSFAGEFAGDYPKCLFGRPAQATIEAMMPSRVLRVTGEQMLQSSSTSEATKSITVRTCRRWNCAVSSANLSSDSTAPATSTSTAPRPASATSSCSGKRPKVERLLRRCPGIVHHLALQDLASFLCVTPNYLSTIRKDITFEAKK